MMLRLKGGYSKIWLAGSLVFERFLGFLRRVVAHFARGQGDQPVAPTNRVRLDADARTLHFARDQGDQPVAPANRVRLDADAKILQTALGLALFLGLGSGLQGGLGPSSVMAAPQGLSSAQRGALFSKANEHFQKGQYAAAIKEYEELLKEPSFGNFALLYNLGNAYFRLGQYGHALAFYRKAQRLRPNHEDLLHNVHLIFRRLQKADPLATSGVLRSLAFASFLTTSQIVWLTGLLLWLAFLGGAWHLRRSPQAQKQSRWLLAWLGLLAFLSVGGLSWRLWQETLIQRAVIVVPKISARSGYNASFEALFLLSEADEIQIHEIVQGWRRISFLTTDSEQRRIRRFGWIPHDALRPL